VNSAGDFAIPGAGGAAPGARLARDGAAIVFTLYSRAYCHLCDDMLAELNAMRGTLGFDLVVVDVDSDPRLEARFGEWVPVLIHQDHELARYRLDAPALEAYLASIAAAAA